MDPSFQLWNRVKSTGKFSFLKFLHPSVLKRTMFPQYNTQFCMHLLYFPLHIPVECHPKDLDHQKQLNAVRNLKLVHNKPFQFLW